MTEIPYSLHPEGVEAESSFATKNGGNSPKKTNVELELKNGSFEDDLSFYFDTLV